MLICHERPSGFAGLIRSMPKRPPAPSRVCGLSVAGMPPLRIGDVDRVKVSVRKERQRRAGGEDPRGILLSVSTWLLRQCGPSVRKRGRGRSNRDDRKTPHHAPAPISQMNRNSSTRANGRTFGGSWARNLTPVSTTIFQLGTMTTSIS
jgi:hypothetical protein